MKTRYFFIAAISVFYLTSAVVQLKAQTPTNNIFLFPNNRSFNSTEAILKDLTNNFDYFGKKINPINNNLSTFNNFAANCSDLNSINSPEAAPCNGVSVTSINFNDASRSIVSGSNNTVGVVYRYANAGTAPDGTVVDAYVTVTNYSNSQDTNQTNFRDSDLIGDETTTNGFDRNLQPNINQESGTFASSTPWNGSITYQINFYRAGTLTPIRLNISATSIDNDGATSCGGLRETVTYSAGTNQILINTPGNTTQIVTGNSVTPNSTTNQAGIGVGNDYANAAMFINVSQFNWTYSFSTTGNCSAGGVSPNRLGSLNLTCQITFDRQFASISLSGNVYNDTNGLTDSTVNGTGTGTPGGTQVYANLLDSNGFVVSSVAVAANGIYSFPNVVAGNYSVQISTNQGIESSPAPVLALPTGWTNTGENLGAGAGSDGTVNGLLSVTVSSSNITNANFGIEQRPVANNNSAASQTNPGGTTNVTVASTLFTASDTSPGTISSIRITSFPTNAASITINGTQYNSGNFPGGGVIIPANTSGNPTQTILIDPIDGIVTVGIPYVAIDNAGFESSSPATASLPFTIVTAASGQISGSLVFNGNPVINTLVILNDSVSGERRFIRTDAAGNYLFEQIELGNIYVVQPLSSKFTFDPPNQVLNLFEDVSDLNFNGLPKDYHPKNDFDGDGKSDRVVYRPSEGNWYILRSSDGEMRVFNFGLENDIPVSADFDGDGITDFAVFRSDDGTWYIRESSSENYRFVRFGLANDKLVPADFDGDGKADIAVYRDGFWHIMQSSNGSVKIIRYGIGSDIPSAADFDGDEKADLAVYRPGEGLWYVLKSLTNNSEVFRFGAASDVPVAEDFDGDGRSDIANFRSGFWYILNSTTDFQSEQFGNAEDSPVSDDFDGDGRADFTVYKDGIWSTRNSSNGTIDTINFGSAEDILIK